MARKILPDSHPILRQIAKPVEENALVGELIDEMIEAMNYPAGIGLAAPQLGESLRIIVLEVPHGRDTVKYTLINPEIYWTGHEPMARGWEGCLSFPPGFRGMITRHVRIKVRAFGRHWQPLQFGARDLVARVIQHELDHLDGKLITDRAERIDDQTKRNDTR